MGKRLIHSNEIHLLSETEIKAAARKMVEDLGLAAGSMEGFNIYKVVITYFRDLEKRHEVNKLLKIVEDPEYCGEEEQIRETIEAEE
ncbi:hypothetical protein M2137_000460 [Parabacteroides sp. PFB2-10]|uniref:hypothetical protein n=1 Tax=Parabacteroides sp. PFB2-10 TaxID=1742405 RepID=UPI0024741586|nr:hypothetical protein [Parabacteroides sp. PFB2-10]MDH6311701.1 hypothetical protein [Parabacteroides sp. PFB2-10]MDL2244978.1 hypothetical protein [Parabacteroides sp. OttesenSCG-928-J18]